jgi:hypothetical protein
VVVFGKLGFQSFRRCGGLSRECFRAKDDEMEDQIKQPPQSEVLPPESAEDKGPELPPSFLEYLESEKGHEIAKTILGLWKELQQVTIGSKTEQQKDQLKRNHEAWKLALITQALLAVVVIGSAVALAWHSKLDATITGFLGVALGYVLGRKTS